MIQLEVIDEMTREAGMGDGHVAEFSGFSALENSGEIMTRKLTGEEAFTTAYMELKKILG